MTNPSARTWSSGGTRHGSEGTHHSHVDAVVRIPSRLAQQAQLKTQ